MGKKKQIRLLQLEVERLRKSVFDRENAIDKLLSDTITDSEKNFIKLERQFAKTVQKEFDRNLLSGSMVKGTSYDCVNGTFALNDKIKADAELHRDDIINSLPDKDTVIGLTATPIRMRGPIVVGDFVPGDNSVQKVVDHIDKLSDKEVKENRDKLLNNMNLHDKIKEHCDTFHFGKTETKSETVAFQAQGRQYRHTEEGDKVYGELAEKPIAHHKVPQDDCVPKIVTAEFNVEMPSSYKCDYQGLFDLMNREHGLILTLSEMHEIIRECQKVVDLINNKEEHNSEGMVTIQVPVGSFVVPPKESKELIIKEFLSILKKDTDYLRSWKDNIAMAFQDVYKWAVDSGTVDIHKIANDAATSFLGSLLQRPCDIIDVAERLYYHMNPGTKMDVPSSAFEMAEKWHLEWLESNSDPEQSFFDWCIENKKVKPTHIEGGPIPQKQYVEFKINLGDNFVKEVEYNGDGVIKTKITYPDADGAPKTMAEIHDDVNLMETIVNKIPDFKLSSGFVVMPGSNVEQTLEIKSLKEEIEILRKRISICFRTLEEKSEIQNKQTLEISNLLEQRVNFLSEIERLKRMITLYQLEEKRDQINQLTYDEASKKEERINNGRIINSITPEQLAERNNLPKTIESLDRIDRFSYITGGFMIKSKVNNGWNDRNNQFLSNAGVLDLWIQGEIEPDFRVNKTFTEKDVNVWGHNVGDVTFHKSELLDGEVNQKKYEQASFILLEDIGNIPADTVFTFNDEKGVYISNDGFIGIPSRIMLDHWNQRRVRRLSNKDMDDSITNPIEQEFRLKNHKDILTYNEKYIFLSDYHISSQYTNKDVVIKEGEILSFLESGRYGTCENCLVKFSYDHIKLFEKKGLVRRLSPLEICGEPQVCAPAKEEQPTPGAGAYKLKSAIIQGTHAGMIFVFDVNDKKGSYINKVTDNHTIRISEGVMKQLVEDGDAESY